MSKKKTTDEELGLKVRDPAEFELEETDENSPYPEPGGQHVAHRKSDEVHQKALKKASKPTISKNDEFGLRAGSVRSRAASLYARPEGATLAEVRDQVGSIQFNVLRLLEKRGWKVTHTKESGEKNRTVTRYFLKKTD